MALADNSYGTVAEVGVFTRHMFDGIDTAFSAATIPTLLQVEKIIDRVSGVLNTALAAKGFTVPVSNATAKLACDQWVVEWSVYELRRGYPHSGPDFEDSGREMDIFKAAADFVASNLQAFKNLGVAVGDVSSTGLTFTGLTVQGDRTDPDNTGYEQPLFSRRKWDA